MKENVYVEHAFVKKIAYIKINLIIANKNVKNYMDMEGNIYVR